MTSRAWLLIGFLFVLISLSAIAEETISATQQETVVSDEAYSWQAPPPVATYIRHPSARAAADEYLSFTGYSETSFYADNSSRYTLWFDYQHGNTYVLIDRAGGCSDGSSWNGSDCVIISYSCPASGGWSLVGQSCVRDSCVEGEIRNEETGACTPPQPQCTIPDGSVVTSGYYNVGTSSTGSPPPTPCLSQCRTSFDGNGPYEVVINGVKNYFMKGVYTSLGETCSPDTPIVDGTSGLPSSSCGAGQQQGTINGKTVCLDSNNKPVPTDAPKTTETTKTPPVTNPDGSTTETETTQNPDGTSTTKTTTTAADGTKTTTTTTNGGQSETPQDGSATEATQKDVLDELKKTECEKNPDAFGCGDLNLNIIDVELPDQTVTVGINPVSVGGSGSCPSDRTASFLGQQISVSWALPCQFANGIRPVVLSIAWLSAALILIGAFRQEG